MFRILNVVSLFILLNGLGCSSQPSSGLPTASMQIGSKTYTLEIAADDAARDHGLMERDTLDSDRGMVFIFPNAEERNFWMHHTRFPLDIIFAGSDARIVSISTMKAYDESLTPSQGLAKYAIELNAGEALAAGVKVADKLTLPQAVLNSEAK